MSEDQLKAFLQAVQANSALQHKLKAAGKPEAIVAIAKEAGFVVSAVDAMRVIAELSDDKHGSWLL
jgi:predicted ribosomally synthesized peptide with nif11-like leader